MGISIRGKWGVVPQGDPLERTLGQLYATQLAARPQDTYLQRHAQPRFAAGQVAVFRWYRPFLPEAGAILDWGCRHAPDSCLLRMESGERYALSGCDIETSASFTPFHQFARLDYRLLTDAVRLPFDDEAFDAVLGAGVLEHVPRDYDSLRELYRVLKPGGRLIITYLPNRFSLSEWWVRAVRKAGYHRRLYSLRETLRTFSHFGFEPLMWGYQTRLDLLHKIQPMFGPLRWAARAMQLQRFTSGLCLVAQKVPYF